MIINSTLAGGGGTELKTATYTIASTNGLNVLEFYLEKSNVVPTNYWFVPLTNPTLTDSGEVCKGVCGYKDTDSKAKCVYTVTSFRSAYSWWSIGESRTDLYANRLRIWVPTSDVYFYGEYQLYYYY